MLVFGYLPRVIFLLVVTKMGRVQFFLTLLFVVPPFILYAFYLSSVLLQRKQIADGEFEIVTAVFSYKSETFINRRLVELLHFEGVRKYSVNHTIFQLAAVIDTFYLVHFRSKTAIELLFPTKMYEYKSTPRS